MNCQELKRVKANLNIKSLKATYTEEESNLFNESGELDEAKYYFGNWIEQAEYYVEVRNILNNLINEL